MSSKAILVFCAQALLIQSVFTQCIGRGAIDAGYPYGYSGLAAPAYGPALAYDGLASPFAYDGISTCGGRMAYDGVYPMASMDFTPTSGGALPVSSASAMAPVGISIMSENAYEGILAVAGELPFVGTTNVDGIVPSVGAGAINHACGNGLNAMTALSGTSSPASVATSTLSTPYGLPTTYGNAALSPAYGTAAYAAPALAATGYAAPALAATAMAAPALAATAMAAPALAYDGLFYDAPYSTVYPYEGLGYADGIEFTATSGGALPVSSASAVPPTGIVVAAETAYEGPLAVIGELPFVGTVGLEGVLPAAGAGAVNHACGNGRNAMISEGEAFAPAYGAYGAYGPATAVTGYNYPARWAGNACGCAY